jgi:hypothetical protein
MTGVVDTLLFEILPDAHALLENLFRSHSQYAWIRSSLPYRATVTQTRDSCPVVSNRGAHDVEPGHIFVDSLGRGFVLLIPFGSIASEQSPTHELVFCLTHKQCRRQGVLRKLFERVPKHWRVWVESTEDTIDVWPKLGFELKRPPLRNHSIDWMGTVEFEREPNEADGFQDCAKGFIIVT